MINNDEIIKKLKMNIAISNLKKEINLDNYEKEYALKNKFWRGYEMKKRIAIIIISILFISGTVFAFELFSGLNGDELSLNATYDGNGIVSIYVENKSDKELNFEENIKLMRWSENEEVKTISSELKMENTKFAPNSTGVMKIDISKMYDLSELEKSLTDDDYYYFILTNNNFIFGNDWQCSIDFSKNNDTSITNEITYVEQVELDENLVIKSNYEELEEYFEEWVINPTERNKKVGEYYQKVYELLEIERKNGKNIISSVDPWLFVGKPDENTIFDTRVSKEMQYQLVGENHFSLDAFNIPVGSSEFDSCMVLNTVIPNNYSDISTADGSPIPLIYIFQYNLKELQQSNSYVFIRGKLYNYDELDKYKVYQDDKYVCYNVTELFYKNLEGYVDTYTKDRDDIYMDDGVRTRIRNIYEYYMNKENLEKAFYYNK